MGDDCIRDWCLYLQEEKKLPTILLSDDINLRNKAVMADISAISANALALLLCSEEQKSASNYEKVRQSPDERLTEIINRDRDEHSLGVNKNFDVRKTEQNFVFLKTDDINVNIVDNNWNQSLSEHASYSNGVQLNDSNSTLGISRLYHSSHQIDNASILNSSFHSCGNESMDVGSSCNDEEYTDASNVCNNTFPIVSSTSKSSNRNSLSPSINNKSNMSRIDIILRSIEITLGNILQYVMEKEFGKLWVAVIIHKPPWKLKEIFACWKKHWLAAFMEKFPSSLNNRLEQLNYICLTKNDINIDSLKLKYQRILNYFDSPPYSDLIHHYTDGKLGEESSPRASTIDNTCQPLETLRNSSKKKDQNVPRNTRNSSEESLNSNPARDLIVATGTRLGQFM